MRTKLWASACVVGVLVGLVGAAPAFAEEECIPGPESDVMVCRDGALPAGPGEGAWVSVAVVTPDRTAGVSVGVNPGSAPPKSLCYSIVVDVTTVSDCRPFD